MNGVIDDDADALGDMRRRFGGKTVVGPAPIADADDVAGQTEMIDDCVGDKNDRQRRQGAGNKNEGQNICESVDDGNEQLLMFIAHHPMRLQHIVTDEVTNQLVHTGLCKILVGLKRSIRLDPKLFSSSSHIDLLFILSAEKSHAQARGGKI